MSQNQPPSLDDLIERFKREISDHAAAERARVTAAADAAINRIHDLEASRNFNAHLHNGDPLTHRTVHVPTPHGRTPVR